MTALLLAISLIFVQPTVAQDGGSREGGGVQAPAVPGGLAEPPALEAPDADTAGQRARDISGGLRCPVCQGLSVADSNADAARAMHARISELVQLGYSKEQIEDYFVDRYGEWVRLAPPAEGLHWIIWLGPVVGFVFGAGWIALRSRASGDATLAPTKPAPEVDKDPYRQLILAELEGPTPPGSDA